MPPWILWTATGVVGATAAALLVVRGRISAVLIAAVLLAVAYLVRTGDPELILPFVLLYLAALIALPRAARLIHGVAALIVMVFAFTNKIEHTDWVVTARDKQAARDYLSALHAFDKALEDAPGDVSLLEDQAVTEWILNLHEKALGHIAKAVDLCRQRFVIAEERWLKDDDSAENTAALNAAVGDYTRTVRTRLMWMTALEDEEAAITELDAVMKNGRLARDATLLFAAADLRLMYINSLIAELGETLRKSHPDRIGVADRLEKFMRFARPESPTLHQLVDPLTSDRLRTETTKKLRRCWELLREADLSLGDLRVSELGRVAEARLTRAELDIKLGRFQRAKEELQCFLETPQPAYHRQRAFTLMADLMRQVGCHYERALYHRELIALVGGEIAPLSFKADYYEALFDAADKQIEFRDLFIAEADKHLAHVGPERHPYSELDMRTLGYRGVAAMVFENDPEKALASLTTVYEALRSNKAKDPSILMPHRARRFLATMLEASLRSPRREDRANGLALANTLVEVAANDVELRKRRADLAEAAGDYGLASSDLRVALRNSRLDRELFDRWISVSERVKDASGRSPREIAQNAADRAKRKLEELREELDRQRSFMEFKGVRGSPKHVHEAFKEILQLEGDLAADPLIAWHMAEEFGRLGETDEARNFLFRAVAAEPNILPMRLRLGELRLDLGFYEEAARDFREILHRDPENVEVAIRTCQALALSGDLRGARELRATAMLAAPTTAGIEFAVRAALDAGKIETVVQILGPYLGTTDSRVTRLAGLMRLAEGNFGPAIQSLTEALATDPESAEILRSLIIATANGSTEEELTKHVERFVRLPRLLPIDEILKLLEQLTALGKHAAVASIADGIQSRYVGDALLELRGRAILANFRAGNATPLRAILDDPSQAVELSDDVVRAAFGVALRERGPASAALFLQTAREYGEKRDMAALASAAAFALTPHSLDVATFLGRFERQYTGVPMPLTHQVAWALTRRRAAQTGVVPLLEPGAEGEIAWLDGAAEQRLGDAKLVDVYLRFLLFRFAGPGFEDDATEAAAKIAAVDRKALTAARYVAERIEVDEGVEQAVRYLLDRYQTLPSDQRTFLLVARMLDDSGDKEGSLLDLAEHGKDLFPLLREPGQYAARAALRAKDFARAETELVAMLDRDKADVAALRLFVRCARESADDAVAERALARVQASGSDDPELMKFLVERCERSDADADFVVATLAPVVDKVPRFYTGAAILARVLADQGKKDELTALAKKLIEVVPGDLSAAAHGVELARSAIEVNRGGDRTTALALADAALLADPALPPLRKVKVDLIRADQSDAASIPDLEVLCSLAPREIDQLFTYGTLLLQERGDKVDVVSRLLPVLRLAAPKDSRYYDLLAEVHFLRPRYVRPTDPDAAPRVQIRAALAQVKVDLVEALRFAEGRRDYWYEAGVITFLLGDEAYSKIALGKLDEKFKYWPRVKYLLELLGNES